MMLNETGEARESLDDFWRLRPATQKTRDFANALIHGVITQQPAIDERIKNFTANYELHRIAAVDRNILRVAIYEMIFTEDVPPVVSINEAIEIAKRFGTEDSGRFVNGILDREARASFEKQTPQRDALRRGHLPCRRDRAIGNLGRAHRRGNDQRPI